MRDADKLAISIARKAGALIFVVPEDLVEVRPRLVRPLLLSPVDSALMARQGLTFIGALMAIAS